MDRPEQLRLFFGLEIPGLIKQRLLEIQQPVAGARWQRADQLHVTLVFLGNVDSRRLPEIRRAARNLPVEPFELSVSGISCFGRPERPKNLWAGVQPVSRLTALHDALIKRLGLCGFSQEKRRFRPHITLSRFKGDAGPVTHLLQRNQGKPTGSFLVDRVTLFESVQGQQGSVYHAIERFPLVHGE